MQDIPLESIIESLFNINNIKYQYNSAQFDRFDYYFEVSGKKIVAEVKNSFLNVSILKNIISRIKAINLDKKIDIFYIVTNKTSINLKVLKEIIENIKLSIPVKICSLEEFIDALSLKLGKDLVTHNINELMQASTYSIIKSLTTKDYNEHFNIDIAKRFYEENIRNTEYEYLSRQFGYKIIERIKNGDNQKDLRIGKAAKNVIVVLSDIKNFSSIVRVCNPEMIKEYMSEYYRKARKIILDSNGVLDKFIGDAVVAVFNYPFEDNENYSCAFNASRELIEMGKQIFSDLFSIIDEQIETGTRVGISLGDLTILSLENREIAFIGNTINLAARLEQNCETNGILVSNLFMNRLLKFTSADIEDKAPKILDPDQAKGQLVKIKCWQL